MQPSSCTSGCIDIHAHTIAHQTTRLQHALYWGITMNILWGPDETMDMRFKQGAPLGSSMSTSTKVASMAVMRPATGVPALCRVPAGVLGMPLTLGMSVICTSSRPPAQQRVHLHFLFMKVEVRITDHLKDDSHWHHCECYCVISRPKACWACP